ncbi:IclR family transcriptional regulator domain-containing protein [Carnimonas nigrificans]|uniref:IclR family transcriptional regulator domain-containing protein n=1 Tax=Carnimonas nigrificans TaxID=64323 RepID=UPI00047183A3|nr:IclR family transcriptional regulator C-terminal domain-containing protein [Carnimonas nigrificans]
MSASPSSSLKPSAHEERISPDDKDYVTALACGLEVITAFDEHHQRMTLSEIAERTGLNRARARRFLLTLHSLGYVNKQARYFELAPKALSLGYSFLSSNNYLTAVQQTLTDITQTLGESSSLGVLDGGDVVYAARSASSQRLMGIHISVGTRLPAVATSMGRVLLGEMEDEALDALLSRTPLEPLTPYTTLQRDELVKQIRMAHEQGYCILDQELELGLRSLAIPLRAANGRLIGAINVSTNAARVEMTTLLDTYLPVLIAHRDSLAAHLA